MQRLDARRMGEKDRLDVMKVQINCFRFGCGLRRSIEFIQDEFCTESRDYVPRAIPASATQQFHLDWT